MVVSSITGITEKDFKKGGNVIMFVCLLSLHVLLSTIQRKCVYNFTVCFLRFFSENTDPIDLKFCMGLRNHKVRDIKYDRVCHLHNYYKENFSLFCTYLWLFI